MMTSMYDKALIRETGAIFGLNVVNTREDLLAQVLYVDEDGMVSKFAFGGLQMQTSLC